jgi:N-acetylmuramoyl-L-alanine amidase
VKNKLILVLFAFLPVLFAVAGNEEKQFVVVIDPGHGGHDPGTMIPSAKEKNIVLEISKFLGESILKNHPEVKVAYTRKTDDFVELDDRANFANKSKADLFISIHVNAIKNNKKPQGAETYAFGLARTQENLEVAKTENSAILLEENYEERYEGFDPNSSESYIIFEYIQNKFQDQSIEFASFVQNELVKTAKRADRGVRQSSFLVLRKASMPRVLIELDFLSNPNAAEYMKSKSGQQTLSRAISNAFDKYYKKYRPQGRGSTVQPATTQNTRGNLSEREISSREPDVADTKTTVNGTVYKVQILASNTRLPSNSRQLKGYKADFYHEKGLYKYTYGESNSMDEISKIRKSLLKDFKDAFIITFKDGEKVN